MISLQSLPLPHLRSRHVEFASHTDIGRLHLVLSQVPLSLYDPSQGDLCLEIPHGVLDTLCPLGNNVHAMGGRVGTAALNHHLLVQSLDLLAQDLVLAWRGSVGS